MRERKVELCRTDTIEKSPGRTKVIYGGWTNVAKAIRGYPEHPAIADKSDVLECSANALCSYISVTRLPSSAYMKNIRSGVFCLRKAGKGMTHHGATGHVTTRSEVRLRIIVDPDPSTEWALPES